MDTGWAAHLGPGLSPITFAARIDAKLRSAQGEHRDGVQEFCYRAFSGEPVDLGFPVYPTIPVDLAGDGYHELVRGYFEGDGTVLDRDGTVLGTVNGLVAMASKFMDLPGEQLLSYAADGTVTIWADAKAQDSDLALARYSNPFYNANQHLTATGYNLFNLGGI